LTFTSIGVGIATACGLTVAGAAYCWSIGNPQPALQATPAPLTALTVALEHACGLTSAGAAYCWGGNNGYGQLGNGTRNAQQGTAYAVMGGLTFSTISAGEQHTCAITTGGATYCWGLNRGGQLGNGSTVDTTLPVLTSGGLSLASLTSGEASTCGLTSAGATYCWGTAGGLFGLVPSSSTTPVAAAAGVALASISGRGESHVCGLTAAGKAYCWGDTQFLELGNGASLPLDVATPVAVSGGLTFTTIVTGHGHTCGIATGGEAYCWGTQYQGLLGDSPTANRGVPQPVRIF
jgi:alpha-tubulin suppressor-like RCC1 family protein